MPLKTEELKSKIYSICENNAEADKEGMMRYFADNLAEAIYEYLLTATVITTGNATTQQGTIS